MATRAYHIVSHYNPPQEPGSDDELENEATWQVGHSFGKSKRATQPPKFVRPSGLYDEYGRPIAPTEEDDDEIEIIGENTGVIGSWYKNLPRSSTAAATTVPGVSLPSATASAPALINSARWVPIEQGKTKSDWFISNILKKQVDVSDPTPLGASSSLSDMLIRTPPPLPNQERFVPPVWVAIGPNNRGYGMLEKHGWEEGQALGLGMRRLKVEESTLSPAETSPDKNSGVPGPDIIDLTAEKSGSESDASGESEEDDTFLSAAPPQKLSRLHPTSSLLADGSRALLTPLPTTLKADRTGIGSKSQMKKTITHTAEALAIHARLARKTQRQAVRNSGAQSSERGAKGFARKMRREERARVDLLAYMKS